MARRNHDEQVDPFNAPDPMMPLDDELAAHDDSACTFDGSPYEAPTTKSSRGAKKRSYSEVAEDDANNDAITNTGTIASNKTGNKSPVRTFKILAIAIVIISLCISFIGIIFSLLGGIIVSRSTSTAERSYSELIEELQNRGYHVDEWTSTSEDDEYSKEATAEAYLTLVVDNRLSALKNDDNLRQMIIDDFNYKFEGVYGFTPEEAGLDTSAYADKVLNSYTYEINSVYAFLDEREGSVYAYINVYQFWDFNEPFDSLAQPYLSENLLIYPTDPSFTVEQKAQLQDYFDEAMSADWELGEDYVSFDFTLEGDTWSINENAYQEEIEYAFSIYYNSTYYAGDDANIGEA